MLECCNKKKKQEYISAIITYKREDILYSVKNIAYIDGDVLPEEAQHVKHQIQDIGEEGNVDRVNDILELAIAECAELLYPLTKHELSKWDSDLDNPTTTPQKYMLELKLPKGFSTATYYLIKNAVREYLINRVLSDWMSIVNPQSVPKYEVKLQAIRDKIHSVIATKLIGCYELKLQPF